MLASGDETVSHHLREQLQGGRVLLAAGSTASVPVAQQGIVMGRHGRGKLLTSGQPGSREKGSKGLRTRHSPQSHTLQPTATSPNPHSAKSSLNLTVTDYRPSSIHKLLLDSWL